MTAQPQARNRLSRPGFVAAAALVVLVVASAVFLLVSGPPDRPAGGQTPPGQAPTASPPVAGPAGGGSVCGLQGVATTGSARTPPDVDWTVVGNFSVPGNTEAGPGATTEDGMRICYQRTPEGALVAAVNYMGAGTDARLVIPMYEYAAADGPGREVLIDSARAREGVGSVRAEVAAYRVLGYDGEAAKIDVVLRLHSGQYLSTVNDLVWEHGDWKVVSTGQGTAPTQPSVITDLDGYVLWGAGS
jgi:hypothetical protein